MGITVWKRGLMRPRFHMGTIQSLTHYHKVFLTIWEFRKKSPYENNNHLVSPFPYGDPRMERGRETKNSHLGTPHNHKVFVTIRGLTCTPCLVNIIDGGK